MVRMVKFNINLADALAGKWNSAKDTGLPKSPQTDYPLVSLHEGLKEERQLDTLAKSTSRIWRVH